MADTSFPARIREFGGNVSISSRCEHRASKIAGRDARSGSARPTSVMVIARAIGSSRPRGLRRTDPPRAITASCKPQQLPQTGTPAVKAARAKSICRLTQASGVVDMQRRTGDHHTVEVRQRSTNRQVLAIGNVDRCTADIRAVWLNSRDEQRKVRREAETRALGLPGGGRPFSNQDV